MSATCLRLVAVDNGRIDMKALEDVDGVKGVFSASGQLQIILGIASGQLQIILGIAFDRDKIAAAGHPGVVAVLVTNSDDYESLTIQTGPCKALEQVIQVK